MSGGTRIIRARAPYRDAIGHHLAAGLHPARLDPERDSIPLLPGLFVGKPLVWQASQAEPGIADPDALTFIGHHFRGDVYQGALPLRYRLPSTFPAVDEHQLMQSKVCVAADRHFLVKQLLAHPGEQKTLLSTVGLSAEASRKVVKSN